MLSHYVKLENRVSIRNIPGGTVIKLWTGRSAAAFLSGTKIFLFSETSKPTTNPNQRPSNCYRGFFPGGKAAGGAKLTTHLNLVLMLPTNGAGPPCRPSWCGQRQIYFYFYPSRTA